MKKYISLDALVAEIKKKIRTEQGYSSGDAECGYRDCAREILSFLDTLEVKEVDLEKEISNWWDNHYHKKFYKLEGYTGHYTGNSTILDIAKHFFELGLKAQKEVKRN